MTTLNDFLRRLPELVVDDLVFQRHRCNSSFHIGEGVWKLHKTGYNEYDVSKLIGSESDGLKIIRNKGYRRTATWSSDKSAGDITILGLSNTLHGVTVTLGRDLRNWE